MIEAKAGIILGITIFFVVLCLGALARKPPSRFPPRPTRKQ